MTELPEGWESISTIDCFDQISTNDKKVKTKDCLGSGLYPVIDQGKNEISGYLNDLDKVIHVEDSLIIFGDHTRAIKWVPHDFIPGADGTKVLKPKEFVDNRCSYFQLKSLEIPDRGYSRHFQFLKGLPFSIPPLNEQIRIANKLDNLLAKVDAAQTRLEKIPSLLKRFRQAVLAAATSGELTREWRELESLPAWSYITLNEGFECIDGDRGPNYPKKGDYLENGDCLFLSTKNVRQYGLSFNETVYISKEKDKQLRKGKLSRNDVVITTRGTLGFVGLYDDSVPYENVRINSGMLILRKKTDFEGKFVVYLISSPNFQKEIDKKQTGSAQPQLPANIIKEFLLPLPSIEEQKEIVRRVESLFALADSVEKQYTEAKKRTDRLTQSLLAKAFRGELVPQDPNDEPASELLKRIQAEREEQAASKPKRKTALGRARATATATASGKVHVTSQRKDQKKDSIREKHASVVDDACKQLKGSSFSIEQFRSVSGFSGDYETLKGLILNLLNGITEESEPLLIIDSWDDKTGDYRLRVKDVK